MEVLAVVFRCLETSALGDAAITRIPVLLICLLLETFNYVRIRKLY